MKKGRILKEPEKTDLTKRVHRLVNRKITVAGMVDELDGTICRIVTEKIKGSDEFHNAVESVIEVRLADRTASIRGERDAEVAAAKTLLVDLRAEFKELEEKYTYLQESLTEDTALANSVRTIFREARKYLDLPKIEKLLREI